MVENVISSSGMMSVCNTSLNGVSVIQTTPKGGISLLVTTRRQAPTQSLVTGGRWWLETMNYGAYDTVGAII